MTVAGPAPLACTVRGCGRRLNRQGGALVCSAGHTFDISRRGYVNLLQPQDRRSLDAGDSLAAVDARSRLLAAGVGRAVIETIAAMAAARADQGAAVADLGCGGGEAVAAFLERRQAVAIGIDLSVPAIERAARATPGGIWVVANVDRGIPLLPDSADVVWSIHGRRHPAACARVLKPSGVLLIAVPAADDLIELREAVLGDADSRDRIAPIVAEHEPFFTIAERHTVREQHHLDRRALLALLQGTYRAARKAAAARVDALQEMTVTLASDVLVCVPRG